VPNINSFNCLVWGTYKRENGMLCSLVISDWWLVAHTLLYSQCDMDYLFTSSVTGVGFCLLTISYDVGCQWFTNFWCHMPLLHTPLHLSFPMSTMRALVPKFHLQRHKESCHSLFSSGVLGGQKVKMWSVIGII
jgi:hypothetical protein